MGKKKNLNGIPGNLALSYLSTLGYYDGGYMSDWLIFVATNNNIIEIKVDILNNKIEPNEADIKPLKHDLEKLRTILRTELSKNGFEMNFIKKAIMKFEIPIDHPKFKPTVFCYPFIQDEDGRIYKPKKPIIEMGDELNSKFMKQKRSKIELAIKKWFDKIFKKNE